MSYPLYIMINMGERYYRNVKNARENLKERDDILKSNKEDILEFDRYLELSDYSDARRYKYLTQLPPMASKFDKPFSDAKKRDIENILLWLKRRDDISHRTKNSYKTLLKTFYKWLENGAIKNDLPYPDCAKIIDINYKKNNDKLPEELLTDQDAEKLIENALNPRDKCLISILHETGARIGELIDLSIGSIEDREHGYKIVVDGKTGSRRIPIIESIPYLNEWLNEHPNRENKNAPLWVNIGEVNKGEPMSYRSIRKMLDKVSKRADIDKPVNPHQFRHSRATQLANKFTEAQLCEFFGWVQGSDVPAKYVHLSGRDIDNAYDQMYGLKTKEEEEKPNLAPRECPRCNEKVSPNAKFCYRCGQALTQESAKKVEESEQRIKEEKADIENKTMQKFVEELNKNEDLKNEFKKLLEKE